MNQGIIERFNEILTPDDDLWILGDLALGKITDSLPLLDLINGRKHIVAGNHDRIWSGHKKVSQNDRDFYAQFGTIESEKNHVIIPKPGHKDILAFYSHFPYDSDEVTHSHHTFDKYAAIRPKRGWLSFGMNHPLIHGHVHQSWKVRDDQINVGVDVNDFRPVSDTQLLEIING